MNGNPVDEANARRLVACWNAAEGLTTEHLESAGNAFNGWKLASYAMNDAKAQRDELLAALKHIEGVALADDSRDLPGIAQSAREALNHRADAERDNAYPIDVFLTRPSGQAEGGAACE